MEETKAINRTAAVVFVVNAARAEKNPESVLKTVQ